MRVFISYTQQDKKQAELIAARLRDFGHEVWYDGWKLRAGDNLIQKINEGLSKADALLVIISRNSLRSKWVMHEFSALAFGELSTKNRRIIPVLIDKSTVPEFLARYVYVDVSENLEQGMNKIIEALSEQQDARKKPKGERKRSYEKAVQALSSALRAGRLTLVCGAGVSIGAGIPSWNVLLLRLLESMMFRISQDHSISLDNVDPMEFQKRYGPSALVVGKYLKSNLGKDFMPELRNALYSKNPTSCDIIEAIAELARPQREGRPLDSIITFNFDGLIEESLAQNNIRHKAIYKEGMRDGPNELPVYHVHGYLPRKGKIKKDSDVVFSEDVISDNYNSRLTTIIFPG